MRSAPKVSGARQIDPASADRERRDEYPTTRETFEVIGVVADSMEHRPGERRYRDSIPIFLTRLALWAL